MLKQNNSSLSSYQRVYLIAGSFMSSIKTLIAIYILIVSYYLLGYFSFREGDYIAIVGLLFIAFVITSPFLAYNIIKVIRLSRKLKEWNNEYLHSSYTVIFDTTLAHGNNIAEKKLYLASFIFPNLIDLDQMYLKDLEELRFYLRAYLFDAHPSRLTLQTYVFGSQRYDLVHKKKHHHLELFYDLYPW